MARIDRISFWSCAAIIVLAAFFYYPKWQQPRTEATLSWDVSGYYLYLPAIFIYQDVKKLSFADTLLRKYEPAPGFDQAFVHPASGNRVMKYSMGQALQMLPGFLAGHFSAKILGAPADGFSKPYQTAISWWSLLVALLGLWVLRKLLLQYFSKDATAATLITLVVGSNYLNYSAFDGAMTHNWLFTCYALLLFFTIKFYENPSHQTAAVVGLLCGWATLTRPTEIISVIIPLLWMPKMVKWHGFEDFVRGRGQFFRQHFSKIVLAAVVASAVFSLQIIYWKYVSGSWLVYSYGEQSFSWRHPHILEGLFSGRAGWLTYSPAMIFAIVGVFFLWKQCPHLMPAVVPFLLLFMYITWAWDIWWYGGSLGQRAMVQSYPVWAFGLAAFFQILNKKWKKMLVAGLLLPCIAFNLWITHQAHRGGLFVSEQMTTAYLLKILGKSKSQVPPDYLKLLDNKDYFEGQPPAADVQLVFQHNFENDTVGVLTENAIAGNRSGFLDAQRQSSETWRVPITALKKSDARWLRASAQVFFPEKEWEFWRMTQFIVRFSDGGTKVKENMVRLQRLLEPHQIQSVWLDARLPTIKFDTIEIFFWNADGQKKVVLDEVKLVVW